MNDHIDGLAAETEQAEEHEAAHQADEPTEQPEKVEDTFPREYVEELRQENAKYRTRAQRVDELTNDLFIARVKLDGRLQDPTDLAFNEELLDGGLEDAITALLEDKPHLASRKVTGDIGAGKRGTHNEFDLIQTIRDLS